MGKVNTEFSLGLFTWQAIIIVSVLLWIYCLLDILKNKFEQNDKLIWILLVIFLPTLGSILYLSIGRNKKIKNN
jgi:hypothetical protein